MGPSVIGVRLGTVRRPVRDRRQQIGIVVLPPERENTSVGGNEMGKRGTPRVSGVETKS